MAVEPPLGGMVEDEVERVYAMGRGSEARS